MKWADLLSIPGPMILHEIKYPPKPISAKSFNPEQRKFLIDKFNLAITEKKLDRAVVGKAMRLRFPREQWLNAAQIRTFWSRLAKRQRNELPQQPSNTAEDVDVQEHVLDPDPYINDYTHEIHQKVKCQHFLS
jgi:hypothetical protein